MRLCILLAFACACGGGSYEIELVLPDGVFADGARVEVAVVPSCAGVDEADPFARSLRQVVISDSTPQLGDFDPGPYGLVAVVTANCERVALACEDVQLNGDSEGSFTLVLTPASTAVCDASERCAANECVPANAVDAGVDAADVAVDTPIDLPTDTPVDAPTDAPTDAPRDEAMEADAPDMSTCPEAGYQGLIRAAAPLHYYAFDEAAAGPTAEPGTGTTAESVFFGEVELGGAGATPATGTSVHLVRTPDTSGEVSFRSSADTPGDEEFTVEFWISLDSAERPDANFVGIFVAELFPSSGFRIGVAPSDTKVFLSTAQNLADSEEETTRVEDPTSLVIGEWTH
ncbi:MAG: hypothetical protein AAF938_20165, partial [Myxococcota bacterium]